MVEIVRAEEGHLDSFYDIVARTYNSGDPISEERKEARSSRLRYVALREGRPVGVYSLYDHDVWVRNGVHRCGGVAAVAVPPEARDGGVGTAMMKGAVARMREEGFALATLYAYREPFYAKAGYASVGRRLKIQCASDRLPKRRCLEVRRLAPDDWEQLVGCYEAFSRQRNGMAVRDEEKWHRVLAENRPLVIYAVGDPVEGYAVVSHRTEFWSTDHVSEFVWSSPRAYDSLLGVLRGLATNKGGLTWFEPGDGPFAYHHLDFGVDVTLMRPIMGRIVDVPGALEACGAEGHGAFSFSVPGEGAWRVEWKDGQVRTEPVESGSFSVSIGGLTQALYGEPSLLELVRNGYTEGSVDEDAHRFFSPASSYCLDYF